VTTNNTLLELFQKQHGQYISGQRLSEELGVSRTAIWKQIHKLEAAGYRFEASSRLGYRLVSAPDELNAESVAGLLETSRFGRQVHFYDVVSSTQAVARELAESGSAEGALVIANQQQNGRGRMGRSWLSPPGKGIWMSMVLRPQVPIHFAPQLTLLTAAALCRSLRKATGLSIGIKWPNDLLIEGKKISGILLESAAEEERLKYVVAGVGISVNLEEGDYTEELLEKATSLRIAGGSELKRGALISAFLKEWEELYDLYNSKGFSPIISYWEELAVSLGKRVELVTPQGRLVGTPVGLHESGAIRVRLDDGSMQNVFSAEMGEPVRN